MVCTELWAECVAVSLYSSKPDEASVETVLHSVIKLEREFTSRVSHCEPGLKAKVYFRDLTDKFKTRACEIADQINNLH